MIPFRILPFLFTTVVALVLGVPAARAGLGGIHDGGDFFSEPAKADATRTIGDVERSMKKDIVVETFKEVPAAVKSGVNLADKPAADRMFAQWAERQAKQESVNGVYVMLVKQPSHLQVVVGTQTQKQAFTNGDREALVSMMLVKLRAKQNDAALVDGVKFIASTMRSHAGARGQAAPVPTTASQGSSSGWLLPVIVGLVVVWVLFGLVRSLFGGGSSMGAPQASGGGGFFRSLIGGMFGAAAGMWMYDQFFGSHGNASTGNDRNDSTDSGFSGTDTDYTSSGGGFGGDSGGGDSGGDSGGGGDF